MYELLKKLFPICRSITGDGVRETLKILKEECPLLKTYEVPSGTKVYDWIVPKEWNIKDAWIKNPEGEKIIDFKQNNLHVLGYSTPVHKKVSLEDLLKIIYTLPEQPDLIPYITSYYKERYGFCMSENQKQNLKNGEYEIFIDSELKDGFLTYGEIIIPGKTEKEVLLSTYICHPSMANNELSGPIVTIELAKWLSGKENKYTYRIVFAPETIGSITYLSRNYEKMKENTVAGYVLTCLGDEKNYSYLASRYGDTLADRAALCALKHYVEDFKVYSFLDRGSDERQYCSPGINLPVCSVMRTKYGDYPEYHTSGDDLNLVTPKGLEGGYNIYKKIIEIIENNSKYIVTTPCEPQLGKRGLYPTISTKNTPMIVQDITNILAYCDGKNDLIDLCKIGNINPQRCIEIVNKLKEANLLEEVNENI